MAGNPSGEVSDGDYRGDGRTQFYRVVGASNAQSRLDVAATRGLTPLVGRESEATMLFERWEQVKDGQGQVVLLSGEAGIGKSRLVQVLKDHLVDEPHTTLECRSGPTARERAEAAISLIEEQELGPWLLAAMK